MNEGNSQVQAAGKTGLSVGQVKYLAGKFRKARLGIFPETLLGELNTEGDAHNPTKSEVWKESVAEKGDAALGKSTSAKAEKKKKAKKKDKKSSKKASKPKKGKKGKKTKKGKKKTGKDKEGKKSK